MKIFQTTLLLLIRLYQAAFCWARPRCRFYPSCSEYAHEAVSLHGPGLGALLTAGRIGRCRPWGGYGFDPVPQTWS